MYQKIISYTKTEKFRFIARLALLLILAVFLFYYFYLSAPKNFPVNKIITIEQGTSFKKIAADFEEQNLVRSAFWFDSFGWFLMSREKIKAGEYFFEQPLSAIRLFLHVINNGGRDNFVKVRIPEGATIDEIVEIFQDFGFKNFNLEDKSLEGYLFPDTYYVPLNTDVDSMISVMLENFENKTTSEMKERGIIIMASLLEKEVATRKDKEIVAGILWKRIEVGMPLQVDAVFPYIMGKHSLQLTLEDLKIDSPYNTYLYKGLPAGPISNPGLVSLESALNPTESKYWFYLSDKQGNIHYSTTYEQHLSKIEKYLR